MGQVNHVVAFGHGGGQAVHGGRLIAGDQKIDLLPDYHLFGQGARFLGIAFRVDQNDFQRNFSPVLLDHDAALLVDVVHGRLGAPRVALPESGEHAGQRGGRTDQNFIGPFRSGCARVYRQQPDQGQNQKNRNFFIRDRLSSGFEKPGLRPGREPGDSNQAPVHNAVVDSLADKRPGPRARGPGFFSLGLKG